MRANPRLAGYLTQALDHELSVVQQYLTQACLCELWQEAGLAAYFRREANEEQGHAAKLICHLLSLGQAPNGTRLRAVRPGRDLREMLLVDRGLELDAVLLYQDALHYAERCRDEVAAVLFAELLADEQGHLAELDRMLTELADQGCDPDRFIKEICHG
ncbi:MAG: ferritin-like domain-containing protein [Pseudomonadota bacterium]